MSTYMFDLEGTLSDSRERLGSLLGSDMDPDNWRKYYKELYKDPPQKNVVDAVLRLARTGHRVMVYSTRFATKYEFEKQWLKEHGLWDKVELLQRHVGTTKGPQLVVKWARRYGPVMLVDDRPEVRKLVQHACPECAVLPPEEVK